MACQAAAASQMHIPKMSLFGCYMSGLFAYIRIPTRVAAVIDNSPMQTTKKFSDIAPCERVVTLAVSHVSLSVKNDLSVYLCSLNDADVSWLRSSDI